MALFQNFARKRFPAKIVVIKSARLERIPLHSWETSKLRSGRWKMEPSWTKGTPIALKIIWVMLVDATTRAEMIRSINEEGSGIAKTRNANGKHALRRASFPKRNTKEPASKTRAAEAAIEA